MNTVSALFLAGSLFLASGQPTAQEAEQFSIFYDAAADLDSAGQISTWEAFLKKNPRSPFAAKARENIAELRGERPKAAAPAPKPAPVRMASTKPAAAPDDYDPDLAFLYEDAPSKTVSSPVAIATPEPEPAPTAAPRPVAKPRPAPTPAEPSYFGSPETEVGSAQTSVWDAPAPPPSSASGSSWDDAPAPAPRKKTTSRSPDELAMASPKASRVGSATPRPQRQSRPVARREWRDTELAAFHARSFGEQYVQSSLTGLEVSRRFGDRIALEVEGAAAASEETDTLRTLRAQGRQPVVIAKFNYAAGGGVQFGVLAPGGRNDLFVLAGGGVVNSDVEICKKTTEGAPCETLYFKGVNFDYAMAGVGHRFFVTSRIALHTELRGRYIFEKVDGDTNPRGSFVLNVGPSVSF